MNVTTRDSVRFSARRLLIAFTLAFALSLRSHALPAQCTRPILPLSGEKLRDSWSCSITYN
jgi:hypothetical protein